MPPIYRSTCSACDHVSPVYSHGYLAVVVDHPFPLIYAHPDDPRLAILAHPVEAVIMEKLGVTFSSAELAGRLVDITNVSCGDCGTMYEIRRVGAGRAAFAGTGCFLILALAAGIGAAVGRHFESFLVGLLAGYFSIVGSLALGCMTLSPLIRGRHKQRVKEFDRGPDCPKCHSKRHSCVSPALPWSKLICPKCGQRTVRVRSIGKS